MADHRILVTGSAGFIGNAFLRRTLEGRPEWQLMTFDAMTYAGHRENLEDLPGASRHTFVEADIADREAVAQAFETFQPTAVVNFAAETHVDRSHFDPQSFVRTNVMGAQVLLDACRDAGIRMVHVSTDEVYGSLPEPVFATLETPLAPTSAYAASKAAADLMVKAAFQVHGQDVAITRCTNNYGPRQTIEKLIPLMIHKARAGEPLPVYGDGLQVRDWIHVDDHADGILATLEKAQPGDIHHFAGNQHRTNIEVVRRICELTGASESLINHVKDRPAHDTRYALDASHSMEALDWAPAHSFEEGLEETVTWYLENEAWSAATASEDLQSFFAQNYSDRVAQG